jgi:hypothetical protein
MMSPVCSSSPSLSSVKPTAPFLLAIGWTAKGFYFSLADQFKILGSEV